MYRVCMYVYLPLLHTCVVYYCSDLQTGRQRSGRREWSSCYDCYVISEILSLPAPPLSLPAPPSHIFFIEPPIPPQVSGVRYLWGVVSGRQLQDSAHSTTPTSGAEGDRESISE